MSEEKQPKSNDEVTKPETKETITEPETKETITEPETKETITEPETKETITEPETKDSVIITKSSYNKMIKGIVAVVAIAAFFGGYSLGSLDNSDTITNDELAKMISDMDDVQPVQAQQASNQPTPIFVSLDDDPIKGDPEAPITIVEFSDFQCPFCSRFFDDTLPLLEENYIQTGIVKLVYRDMPLQIHPNAFAVHVAAECADDQDSFWEFHDILFERQNEWNRLTPSDLGLKMLAYAEELELDSSFSSCIQSSSMADEIRKDYSQGAGYGVTGTPSFFVGNDEDGYVKLSGAQPFSTFRTIIDSQLG